MKEFPDRGDFTDYEKQLFDQEGSGNLGSGYLQRLSEAVTGEKIPDMLILMSEPRGSMLLHAEKNEPVSEYLKNIFKDKKILELGCGTQTSGVRIAQYVGAKEYVGVESNKAKTAKDNIPEEAIVVPHQIVQADMLDFLRSAGEGSFDVVFLVGIDEHIIEVPGDWKALGVLIPRVLSEGGYLLAGGNKYFPYPAHIFESAFSLDEIL